MRTVIRILAIVLALFILAGALGDIFGLLRHGHVSAYARFHRNFIPVVTAILLLVPAKSLKNGFHSVVYLVALFAVNCWYSLIWMQSIAMMLHGHVNLRGISVGLLMMAILWGTFWIAANHYFIAPAKRKA